MDKEQDNVLKVSLQKISSKAVNDPIQKGFTFIINGHVYQCYDVRDRGRKFIKFLGLVKEASHGRD